MPKIRKKDIDREVQQLNQVAEGVTMIRDARNSMEQLAVKYDAWIDEAALLGEDEYSDQLIADQVELEEFARDLKFLETRIVEGATTAKAFNSLSRLPAALKACKSLLAQGPDLKKLGKQMATFKKSMDSQRSSLKDLRAELSSSSHDTVYAELFGRKATEDPKITEKIEDKKRAREARLAEKMAKERAKSENPVPSEIGSVAGNIDAITAMIDEESKKGDD